MKEGQKTSGENDVPLGKQRFRVARYLKDSTWWLRVPSRLGEGYKDQRSDCPSSSPSQAAGATSVTKQPPRELFPRGSRHAAGPHARLAAQTFCGALPRLRENPFREWMLREARWRDPDRGRHKQKDVYRMRRTCIHHSLGLTLPAQLSPREIWRGGTPRDARRRAFWER